ncbi:MAG: response regulator transcription factor [Ignavibacteriae bacterium]|nr:response regulator transcription factor [Ignavibacteriota bacterium]
MGKRVLLVEDEAGLVLTLTDRLKNEGYRVTHAGDGAQGERLAKEGKFDVILLDVMLPQKSGFDVIRDLRQQGITTPTLMLTARGQVNEKVVGLKLGADDYLTKPFEMLELLARIESLLRRPAYAAAPVATPESYEFGDFVLNFKTMEVTKNRKALELSAREFQLLRYFVEHRGVALSRETILNNVWGYDSMPATRTIDTHVTWLRQKLEDNPKFPKYILTVHGFGYKFVA